MTIRLPAHDTPPFKLLVASKITVPIKQEYPSLASTYPAAIGKRELEWSATAHPTSQSRRKTEVIIKLSIESDDENFAEPKLFKSEPSAQPSSCLADAQLLWRSSTEAQSHQFPVLIKKLRSHLFA